MTAALIAGAMLGIGLTVAIAALRPAAPDLSAAVARLNSASSVAVEAPAPASGVDRAWLHVTELIADRLSLAKYRSDLALLGITPARLAGEKVGYAVVGLVFPILMTSILSLGGIALPVAIPAIASLGLAAGLFFIPEIDLRRKASLARTQMRRTICAYLELVALERAADAGPVEALDRASEIGQGSGFDHIRDALMRARIEARQPWHQLAALSDELRIPELRDVADIMRLSGEAGAAVLPTLRARAASLRVALLQADIATANAASERMSIPVALLGVAFMALLGFPAFSRILFG